MVCTVCLEQQSENLGSLRYISHLCFFPGLGLLLVSRWTDQGPYRFVEIKQEPGESNLDVRKRYFKEKLFPPETKESFDKFSKLIKGKEVKSEESSSTDSKTSSDSGESS